jgi:hypothetical protein
MLRSLTIAAVVPLLVLPAPAGAVTAEAFDRVQAGWTRAHVQRVFDDTGTRTVMWASGRRRHLEKSYPADDGGVYVIDYVGPLCSCGPFAGPYHVRHKEAAPAVVLEPGA